MCEDDADEVKGYLDSRWSCGAAQRARTVATDAKGGKDTRMKQDTSKSPWNTDAKKGWSKIVAAKRIPGKVSGTQARHLIRWKNGNTGVHGA